jgi:hypothetical protein
LGTNSVRIKPQINHDLIAAIHVDPVNQRQDELFLARGLFALKEIRRRRG